MLQVGDPYLQMQFEQQGSKAYQEGATFKIRYVKSTITFDKSGQVWTKMKIRIEYAIW